jgi:hypothetical protein
MFIDATDKSQSHRVLLGCEQVIMLFERLAIAARRNRGGQSHEL